VLEAGGRTFTAARVVLTIPIEHAQRLCGLASDDQLQTVTLISLFFSFSGDRRFRQSVLYNFSSTGAWKRLTVYSDFYGPSSGREYFAAEVNAEHVSGSAEVAERDFRDHVAANGLFDGDLRLEGSNVLTNAYPVYTDNAEERVNRAIAALRTFGVESLGRQGGFDYQPTARHSTIRAEAALGFTPQAQAT
jgi:protoporphyrinogen oxidase